MGLAKDNFKKLQITLNHCSYPILIGKQFRNTLEFYYPYLNGNKVLIITDSVVAKLYLEDFLSECKASQGIDQFEYLVIETGEENKSLKNAERIWTTLIEKKFLRDSTIIALGGGVIGDLAGFCAACYLRGINFIQVPTTLLAQVDASVGGKTAINHVRGKNLIGAFYQPKAVIIDVATLKTLPERIYIAGIAEVIKIAITLDEKFFFWLEKNVSQILAQEEQHLSSMIENAVRIKAKIVEEDEKEEGTRALLNFGHTLGHALEIILGYDIYHGEAVSIGMMMAAKLSNRLGLVEQKVVFRLEALLKAFGLPVKMPENISNLTKESIFQAMSLDKKNRAQQYNWVLLTAYGKSIVQAVSKKRVEETLSSFGL